MTGVLQSTLGNLPEFFVVIFALSEGEIVVAQFSIIGSIFANALLVLGLVIVVGARAAEDGVMRFSARLPNDTTTLLLLSGFIIVLVGISSNTHDKASDNIAAISAIASVALLLVYGLWVFDYLRSETPEDRRAGEDATCARPSIILLALGGLGAAFVSDWFVAALRPTIDQLGDLGAVRRPRDRRDRRQRGRARAGVVLAAKGQADLAISVVKNSVSQVAAFLSPALVLVSLLFTDHLTFAIAPVYVGALALTIISVWQVTGDGEATLLRRRGADRDVRDPGSLHALRMTDFATTISDAYATEGEAVDLGRGVHEGELFRDAAVRVPLATMNRHGLVAGATGTGKTKSLQLLAEQLSRAGVPVLVADVKGDVSGLAAPAPPGGPGESRMADLGLPFAPDAFPGRVPLARRARPRRARPRDRERLRPAAAGQGARGERDAGAEPRARLPLRGRQGPAAARPERPARAADLPRLRRGQGGARGDRRAVDGDGRRAAALARRARDRRWDRVLRRAAARRRRPAAHRRRTAAG